MGFCLFNFSFIWEENRDRKLLSIEFIPQYLQWSKLSCGEAGSQECYPGLSYGRQKYGYMSCHHCLKLGWGARHRYRLFNCCLSTLSYAHPWNPIFNCLRNYQIASPPWQHSFAFPPAAHWTFNFSKSLPTCIFCFYSSILRMGGCHPIIAWILLP